MRVTTQMLNETARKAGLPINNSTLLDYINNCLLYTSDAADE